MNGAVKKLLSLIFVIVCLIVFLQNVGGDIYKDIPLSEPETDADGRRFIELGINITNKKLDETYKGEILELCRGDTFELNYKIKNKSDCYNCCGVYITNSLTCDFEFINNNYTDDMKIDKNGDIASTNITLNLDSNSTKNYTYHIKVRNNATPGDGKYSTNKTIIIYDKETYNIFCPKSDPKNDIDQNDFDKINIKNNPPEITSASAFLSSNLSNTQTSSNNDTLIIGIKSNFFDDTVLNSTVKSTIDAVVEDADDDISNLKYNWTFNNTFFLNNKSGARELPPLKEGILYSFSVNASDSFGPSEEFRDVEVFYNNYGPYNNFKIKKLTPPPRLLISFITIAMSMLIFGLIIRIFQKSDKNLPDRRIALGFFGITWIIYIVLARIYVLTYLAIFECILYITIFAIVTYFNEDCFKKIDFNLKNRYKTTNRLMGINIICMTALLLLFIFVIRIIISFDENGDYLEWYYSTMSQVFASILAIVAVIHTALPDKNVAFFRKTNEICDVVYEQPIILNNFVGLFGIILVLSLIGISTGINIEFKDYIEMSWSSLSNLISIGLFELTLLLIIPAITCLYVLMRTTMFRGTIEIIGDKNVSNTYEIWIEHESIEYETHLKTPNTLLLLEGDYLIILRNSRVQGVKSIEVKPATKQTLIFEEYDSTLRFY